jgi:hypothetical protein
MGYFGPMLQQLLEKVLSDHRSQGSIRNFLDKLPDLASVVPQLIDQFVRVDSPIVHDRLNAHADVVLGDDLLRSH